MSRPKKNYTLDAQRLEALLSCLNPDRQVAARKYTQLQRALMDWFYYNDHDCLWSPEELADETLDRLATKIIEGSTFQNVTTFAIGIARFVLSDSKRSIKEVKVGDLEFPDPEPLALADNKQLELVVDQLLEGLPPESRALILGYYDYDKGERISSRKKLSINLKITDNALRGRIHRIKEELVDSLKSRIKTDSGS